MTLPASDGSAFFLLKQVEQRLLEKLPEFLNAGNCLLTDEPLPDDSYFGQGKVACTICLLDGRYDKRLWRGGAGNQLNETSDLVVTVLSRSKLDQPGRATAALLDADRGLLSNYKPLLLRAILVDDPTANILQPWIPLTFDNHPFLRDGIEPNHCQGPSRVPGRDWLGLSLHFDVSFDWDLRLRIPPA